MVSTNNVSVSVCVLADIGKVASALSRRGLKVRPNGRVWSTELETFVSSAEALLAGLGKARRTRAEREVFDLLLLNAAGKAAVKVAKARAAKAAKHPVEIDREKELDRVVEIQERMAKGMVLIEKTDRAISAGWKRNDFAPYIYKAWSTPVSERTEKQRKALAHPNNRLLINWFEHRKMLWAKWHALRAMSSQLATEHGLWPMFFRLERTAFTRDGFELRPEIRDENVTVPAPESEEPSEVSGVKANPETLEDMADGHAFENAVLEAAFKACEYHKRKRYSFREEYQADGPAVGARVKSRAFGPGKVTELMPSGKCCWVQFGDGSSKLLAVSHLEQVDQQAMSEAELASLMAMADNF